MTQRDRLRSVIQPVAEGAGYDLEDLELSRAGRRYVLRVIIDIDGGASLDGIAEVSRAVSAALDAAERAGGDLIRGEYVLEVSSPGTDRPLTAPRHWRRNVGRLVEVRADGSLITGRIEAADGERVRLDTGGTVHDYGYERLGPGRVQVEFSRLGNDDISDDDLTEDDLTEDDLTDDDFTDDDFTDDDFTDDDGGADDGSPDDVQPALTGAKQREEDGA
jgi:ribosome maturation factor RimP